MNFDFFSGCRGPRFRDGGGRFALQVILPRGILNSGRFLPARLGLRSRFTFLGRCRRRGRFTRRFGRSGGHREGGCGLGSVRNGSSKWPFGGAVKQSMKFEPAMETTNTHRATCAHERLEVAGILALGRTGGMGWDLTEGEGAVEPLAVEVAPAPKVDSVLLPHVPAWVSEELPHVPAWVSEVLPQPV
jgi:hypothetical protein